nr:MAG TPA: hypothetical protein [Caudoviricetes sp.]
MRGRQVVGNNLRSTPPFRQTTVLARGCLRGIRQHRAAPERQTAPSLRLAQSAALVQSSTQPQGRGLWKTPLLSPSWWWLESPTL